MLSLLSIHDSCLRGQLPRPHCFYALTCRVHDVPFNVLFKILDDVKVTFTCHDVIAQLLQCSIDFKVVLAIERLVLRLKYHFNLIGDFYKSARKPLIYLL